MAVKQFSNWSEGPASGSRKASPISIGVGRSHIRATATGSAAELGRQLNASFKELGDDLTAYFRMVEDGVPEDMLAAMAPTMDKAKVLCPKDTTELVNSAYMAIETFRGGSRLEMGFGKDNKPDYAIYVHEMTTYQHEAPTQAKFLEQPINEDFHLILQRISESVKKRTGV